MVQILIAAGCSVTRRLSPSRITSPSCRLLLHSISDKYPINKKITILANRDYICNVILLISNLGFVSKSVNRNLICILSKRKLIYKLIFNILGNSLQLFLFIVYANIC